MRWELFCRVVDNFGDIGFAWRLAADLAARGEAVRLVVDDASALRWLAPRGAIGVAVHAWPGLDDGWAEVGVETFGCGCPRRASRPLVSINVEHLSAEAYAARSHGLPSPRTEPDGTPTTVWLYYPGFGEGTGGLLREPGSVEDGGAHEDSADEGSGERRVVLFSYANEAYPVLFDALAVRPTRALLCPGAAHEAGRAWLGPSDKRGALRGEAIPFCSQIDFDALLRSSTLNFVRGEDSLVRALWAGVPFVWQLYPQADGAHRRKLEAFLDCFLDGADAGLQGGVRSLFRRWNGVVDGPVVLPDLDDWRRHCRQRRHMLLGQPDLTTTLLAFARTHSSAGSGSVGARH